MGGSRYRPLRFGIFFEKHRGLIDLGAAYPAKDDEGGDFKNEKGRGGGLAERVIGGAGSRHRGGGSQVLSSCWLESGVKSRPPVRPGQPTRAYAMYWSSLK